MKDPKIFIACTKSFEVNIQFDQHFDFQTQRLLLNSIDLFWMYFDLYGVHVKTCTKPFQIFTIASKYEIIIS